MVIGVSLEVAVDVAEDEEDGAMIAGIQVGKQTVTTGHHEMTEDLRHFVTTEAGIAVAGIIMIASEVAEYHLLKVEHILQIIHLAKVEMGRQTWVLAALGEAQEMARSQVARQLQILYSRQVLLVVMDEAIEATVDVEEATTRTTTDPTISLQSTSHDERCRISFRLNLPMEIEMY